MTTARSLCLSVALAAGAACTTDPVAETAERSLGDEDPRVGPRPEHRAGQPCTVCHEPGGAASSAFAIAGTVVWGPRDRVGVAGVRVEILDARPGVTKPRVAVTNCAGNFFLRADEVQLSYPVLVRIVPPVGAAVAMQTPIFRERSCAGCHEPTASARSPGPVVLVSADDERRMAYAPPRECLDAFPWLGAPR